MPERSTCSVGDCEDPAQSLGWCNTHYQRWRRNGDPEVTVHLPRGTPEEKRFWCKVDKDGPVPEYAPHLGQCWIWTASKIHGGYGQWCGSTTHLAHRYSYELENGSIPPELQIDHLCRVPACVRPSHLEAVTQHANILRIPERAPNQNARKTHCAHGHLFDEANTYRGSQGERRQCRTCRREIDARRRAAKKNY